MYSLDDDVEFCKITSLLDGHVARKLIPNEPEIAVDTEI